MPKTKQIKIPILTLQQYWVLKAVDEPMLIGDAVARFAASQGTLSIPAMQVRLRKLAALGMLATETVYTEGSKAARLRYGRTALGELALLPTVERAGRSVLFGQIVKDDLDGLVRKMKTQFGAEAAIIDFTLSDPPKLEWAVTLHNARLAGQVVSLVKALLRARASATVQQLVDAAKKGKTPKALKQAKAKVAGKRSVEGFKKRMKAQGVTVETVSGKPPPAEAAHLSDPTEQTLELSDAMLQFRGPIDFKVLDELADNIEKSKKHGPISVIRGMSVYMVSFQSPEQAEAAHEQLMRNGAYGLDLLLPDLTFIGSKQG